VVAKQKCQHGDGVTLERLLRAQTAIAYAMTLDGAIYAPVFERLEREIAARRAADDIVDRARRCLDGTTPLLEAPQPSV
jgi:hypothetical protein